MRYIVDINKFRTLALSNGYHEIIIGYGTVMRNIAAYAFVKNDITAYILRTGALMLMANDPRVRRVEDIDNLESLLKQDNFDQLCLYDEKYKINEALNKMEALSCF